jgi:hypothetical protein
MTTVPAFAPETKPVPDTTPAMDILPLVQAPPAGDELNDVVEPTQTLVVPVMAEGNGYTVTVVTV